MYFLGYPDNLRYSLVLAEDYFREALTVGAVMIHLCELKITEIVGFNEFFRFLNSDFTRAQPLENLPYFE